MKIQWKKLLICLAVPLAVGGLSAFLTRDGMERFRGLDQPPLSPPGWVFPVVWTILFLLMGYASYLVLTSGAPRRVVRGALAVYGVQLAVNFLWSIIFFNLGAYLFALLWLILLWVLIAVTMAQFRGTSKPAGDLLLPYLAWVTFAGYLNCGIWILN